jgi:hypothetical protein
LACIAPRRSEVADRLLAIGAVAIQALRWRLRVGARVNPISSKHDPVRHIERPCGQSPLLWAFMGRDPIGLASEAALTALHKELDLDRSVK